SARHASRTSQTALPLVVRHTPVHVEAQGRAPPSAPRHARLRRDAERVGLPDSLSPRLAADGLDVPLDVRRRGARTTRTPVGVRRLELPTGRLLLRALPRR